MRQQEKIDLYFDWLVGIVSNSVKARKFDRVLRILYETPFRAVLEIPMDINRGEDGLYLRSVFFEETNIKLPDYPCSILEVMVALAQRCEHDIMHDDMLGDRTERWFWEMVSNLGITQNSGDEKVCAILDRFLNRQYAANGKGGLFKCDAGDVDMRELEIWAQMNVYLNTII